MNTKTYKDLLFWQSAFQVSKEVIELLSILPKCKELDVISYQILRSSTSVGANIAEGYGRYGPKESQRFLQISLGSANETEYWLNLLFDIFPKYRKKITTIISHNEATIKMLASSIKTIRGNRK